MKAHQLDVQKITENSKRRIMSTTKKEKNEKKKETSFIYSSIALYNLYIKAKSIDGTHNKVVGIVVYIKTNLIPK